MKRASLLAFALLLFALSGILVVVQMPEDIEQLPELAQVRLGEFLAGESWSGSATVDRIARAHRPWLFLESWGFGGSDGNPHFRTAGGSHVLSAVRFPPDQLWCVLLKRAEPVAGERSYDAVFVGLHVTMYNADWVIHKATDGLASPEFHATLSKLDCDLGLTEVGPRYKGWD
jgi:hypothetical protein